MQEGRCEGEGQGPGKEEGRCLKERSIFVAITLNKALTLPVASSKECKDPANLQDPGA